MTTTHRSLRRGGVLVAVGTVSAHLLGYVFNLTVSRALGPDSYGELAALLGVVTVACVPGLALQAVVSRRTARHGLDDVVQSLPWLRDAGRAAWGLGLLSASVLLLVGVALVPVLDLTSYWSVVFAAATVLTFPVIAAAEGSLQGSERFATLSGLFISTALLRLVAGALPALLGLSTTAVLAGGALGMLSAAVVAVGVVPQLRPLRLGAREEREMSDDHRDARREIRDVTVALGALLTLVNLDVVLARAVLPPSAAGLYAAGALVTRAVYWGPQFVAVTVFPRLSDPTQARAILPRALGVVAALGAAATVGAALLGPRLVDALLGRPYESLGSQLWRFAFLGGLLALGQLLVSSSVAARDRAMIWVLAACAAVELLLVVTLLHDSVAQVLTAAQITAFSFVCLGVAQRFGHLDGVLYRRRASALPKA